MRWPSVKSKTFASGIAISLISSPLAAVEDKDLWLPGRYAPIFLELKKAAEAAESLDRCVRVQQGTIDLDDSRPDHPVYRILCKQENGRNYNEMVDGLSFETLTTKVEIPVEPTAEELEAIRLAEEKRKEEEKQVRISHLWGLCEEKIRHRVRLMSDFSWVTELPVTPDVFEEASVTFTVDFDAKDMHKQPLYYRAVCDFSENDALAVMIKGRK